nr:alpha/beta hydrolase [uncultured Cohaesibacter sp.]
MKSQNTAFSKLNLLVSLRILGLISLIFIGNWPTSGKSEEVLSEVILNSKAGEKHRDSSSNAPVFSNITSPQDVMTYPGFGDFGRLIFPVRNDYFSGNTLGTLSFTWYNNIQPDKTVEIVNYMKRHVDAGKSIFYDIYTKEEKAADPTKMDTGLFFFKGNPGEKLAITNSGGGFVYVGAMHDSFPHALELSKKGYNAFALIYRPGTITGCEDLARAIAFIFDNADELEVDTEDYSLWGGSAGARIAAWLGANGTESYGQGTYPRPAAVVMQYTALSEVTGDEPPTYNNVGSRDAIADYRIMERRINAIKENGTDTEIEVFEGLPHGFGLGTGTISEGWLDNAVKFWERQMK